MQQALRIDQRAWVAPHGASGTPELGQRFVFTVILKNTGKTFAEHCMAAVACRTKELADPDPSFDAILSQTPFGIIGLLAPNQEFHYTLPVSGYDKLTQETLDSIDTPTSDTLVFGKITYRDIFKSEHWTTFCYSVRKSGAPHRIYGTYNDAGDN
jgi:hypothetical protein